MIKSQIITLRVFYDDESDDEAGPKDDPAIWDWSLFDRRADQP